MIRRLQIQFEFVEPQAKKLGMAPEEYFKKYIEKTTETSLYVTAYVQKLFREPNVENIEEYDEKVNNHLNELVEENKAKIKILISN
ncbi:hypothetical protein [Bacillus sp. AK128]